MTVNITDISKNGNGIGRTEEGLVVFVPGTVPGDIAEIEIEAPKEPAAPPKGKKSKAFEKSKTAKLLSIAKPSEDRIEPLCRYANECGGCPLSGINYSAQLRLKAKHVKDALERIGGFKEGIDYEFKDIMYTGDGINMPVRYRNKAEFAISGNKVGYLKRGSHDILEVEDCLLNPESFASAVEEKRESLKPTQKYFTRFTVRCSKDGDIMTITDNKEGGATADRRILRDEITTALGSLKTEVSPLSFYQVNPECCNLLYSKAQEYAALTGSERVLDLYCGAGSIGLSMASKCARVIGVESVKPAVIDANRNAVINGIVNATFICGKAEDVIDTKLQGVKADVVIVDPPRAGCEKSLLLAIKRIAPERIVYVSCDPATLARDLKILCSSEGDCNCSYKLIEATPADMFPGSLHCEVVTLLHRA